MEENLNIERRRHEVELREVERRQVEALTEHARRVEVTWGFSAGSNSMRVTCSNRGEMSISKVVSIVALDGVIYMSRESYVTPGEGVGHPTIACSSFNTLRTWAPRRRQISEHCGDSGPFAEQLVAGLEFMLCLLLFIGAWGQIYVIIVVQNPNAIVGIQDRIDAHYFAASIFTTVTIAD